MRRQIIAMFIAGCTLALCSCSNGHLEDDGANNTASYIAYRTGFTFEQNSNINFDIIQVSEMADTVLQDQINQSLLTASTEWLDETCTWMTDSDPVVVNQSAKYLTVEREVVLEENPRFWYLILYITVNMETGELVKLEDLIPIDEEYALKLKNEYVTHEGVRLFESWSVQKLLEMLETANMTEAEYLLKQLDSVGSTASYLSCKPSFAFEEDRIYLKYTNTWGDFIVIDANDGSFITDASYAGG